MLTRREMARELRVPAHWVAPLLAAGASPRPDGQLDGLDAWSPDSVAAWVEVRDRRWARTPLTGRDLRLVALGLQRTPIATVARCCQLTAPTTLARQLRAAVRLVSGVSPFTVLGWQQLRVEGLSDQQIAAATDSGVSIIRLALDGLPPTTGPKRPVIDWGIVEQAWRDGLPLDDVAAAVGVARAQLLAWLRRRSRPLQPPRLNVPQAAAYLGWSRGNTDARARRGTMPEPDGHDRGHKWWWANTLDAFAAPLTPCPACGARVRMPKQHQRAHQGPKPGAGAEPIEPRPGRP
ncbi:MAG TPA: hypothetical protein VFJ97_13915 [Dermatophilaceae bacterium]|nr:hypothetical protein [Dermatophilaceae bacterium]